MNITLGLINGLLLLAKLHSNSRVSTYKNKVFFEILVEDNQYINIEDELLLENWGWTLRESEDLDIGSWE